MFGAHYLDVCSYIVAARVRARVRAKFRAFAKRNDRNNSMSQAGKEAPRTHATIGVSQPRSYPIRHVPCEARLIVGTPYSIRIIIVVIFGPWDCSSGCPLIIFPTRMSR